MSAYFEYAAPFLLILGLLAWGCRRAGILRSPFGSYDGRFLGIILPAASFLTFFPIQGLSAADCLLSFNMNFSIGSIAFFGILTWKGLTGKSPLTRKQIQEFSLWNIFIALPLYASSLGFLSWDLYALGYRFSILFVITAIVTVFLVLYKHPLSFIFVAYIVAFHLRLLPSQNFFDYITDGVLFFISLSVLAVPGIQHLLKKVKIKRISEESA